ncbi:hypothetical protein TBR22_A01810 [Luteitalea sp. TBR-22]|uniref:DUF1553 domain-containing protein n=1 Tax=Luteitalea sp. TBR-22 TaxID=2802971 RepID=UPI001AF98AFA|nr:DUF1553 domain-containing protein [Luteitalea sp. TBR-22]BCS30980.1 hypothetical protein TBR22_A01810 [Luteitalea sp. TBR-22]
MPIPTGFAWRALLGALLLGVAAGCSVPGPSVPDLPERVDFALHVRPILSDRCFKCHGPDGAARKSDLRLDQKEVVFSRLTSGATAVVPGRPRKSELVRRILSDDPGVVMPTPDSHLELSDYEKAILIRWIDQGAEWKPHWAFSAPTRPEIPAPVSPAWTARNPIDRFVHAELKARGLAPQPEAPKETLIRRVTFTLTGLPPTPEEVAAFVRDTRPDAYERLVDRLLASPAYGERMAAEWLDIARFADTHGYQDDVPRDMSPWRDWVIGAFNRNMPVDQFVTWQLAGDLLPGATREQRLATAFNRHHMQSQEGGIVPEEYRVEYVADRVQTLGRAFLGVTLECARCHDHKYDPVQQKEYFQLFAFFNSINEAGQAPYSGMASPTVILPSAEAEATLAALRAEREPLERALAPDSPTWDAGFEAWLKAPRRTGTFPSTEALEVHLPLEDMREGEVRMVDKKTGPKMVPARIFANVGRVRGPAYLGGDEDRAPVTVDGRIGKAQRLRGDSEIKAPDEAAFFDRHQPFSLATWMRIDVKGTSGPFIARSGSFANGYRGYLIRLEADGTVTAALHHVAPDDSIEVRSTTAVAPSAWHHLALTYDGSSRAAGLRLFLDGAPLPTRTIVDNLHRSLINSGIEGRQMSGAPLGLRIGSVGELAKESIRDVSVDDFRAYGRQLSALEIGALATGVDTRAAALAQRTPASLAALREHYLLDVDADYRATLARVTAIRGRENEILTAQPSVMAMRELPTPRPTFILARGAYDAPTTRVQPGTPAALLPFPKDLPPNRLGLAKWLLSPSHPLTARVFVNRYWAMAFGRGLVATAEDFGSQGRMPTHPALLDWLATTFVRDGWNAKAMQRLIVTSATYRQASVVDAAARAADPDNTWLARGPAYRMSVEQVRDAALAVSGLLVRRIGGPSVYPYQPAGLWESLAAGARYPQSTGEGLYRRSLYTAWKRAAPPPSAIGFDASERLTCIVTRQRTNTPQQALILLNDPQFVEGARVLAEQVVRGASSPADRIAQAYRQVLTRSPSSNEVATLTRLLEREQARYASSKEAAVALLATGEHPRDPSLDPVELAAWTIVTSTIMNLDDAVFLR